MILHIENPKDTTRKLQEVISEFSKVTRYKMNTEKLLESLCTNNETSEREIKVSILFTIGTKRIKCLGIDLLKEKEELYIEKYKTLRKEIKDNINRWRVIPLSGVGRINIVKMTMLPNIIYSFNATCIKFPVVFFTELEQKAS